MSKRFLIALLAGLACLPALSASPAALVAAASSATAATPLTKTDVDTWLDGFLPYALWRGDIAGAVVTVVKDGQVLTQRGFGYADLATRKPVDADTMFRVGSTSKLFTWIAVMQQVEQGRIDLDADINRYLDFKIPPFEGRPITMRHIMTHTSGFDDVIKGGYAYSGPVDPLGTVVQRLLPPRIRAAGSTHAYSNYATALAGYIVERVSGTPFDTYIERHIFQPLEMTHSSFRQPLPAALQPFMATGYPRASAEPKPFEVISVPPAGSLSMSGADAAKFMISQLDGARGLLKPETAREMQTPRYASVPGLNRMALGFYEERVNDTYAIAHGGDLINMHGYLWLFPEKNVGLLLEMNSEGQGRVAQELRQAFFDRFADRYFPASNPAAPVELATAREHARLLQGNYVKSNGAFTTFLDIGNLLGQFRIDLSPDGHPRIPELFDASPKKWIEVAPFVWQDAFGHARVAAVVDHGHVDRWSLDEVAPFMEFDRVPWYRDASWLMPLLQASLALVAIVALAWPVAAVARRIDAGRGGTLAASARRAGPLTAFAWLVLIVIAGWVAFLDQLGLPSTPPDALLWMLQIGGAVGCVGLLVAAGWRVARDWTSHGALARAGRILTVLAAAVVLWTAVAFHLVSFGVKY